MARARGMGQSLASYSGFRTAERLDGDWRLSGSGSALKMKPGLTEEPAPFRSLFLFLFACVGLESLAQMAF